ncbi:hypothetical protein [Rugamonas sp.]|uniref:hypothetical protein n=1 Tax=Rugamonas sp. TaxID=1926287 RepID=UPI0025E1473F|nr:hypothetical protein [Rugamonas sp.]
MRLPGTRYQEHGWEQVRKLLGRCSLHAFRQLDMALMLDAARHAELLDHYTDAVAAALRRSDKSARAEAAGNSYGDSVCELALSLVFELQAQPAYWAGLTGAIAAEHARIGAFWQQAAADGNLRKKVNDMYAGLRDKIDADNYTVNTGVACSPNKIYTYRMLDTAYRDIAQLFAGWRQHAAQVGAILGRELAGIPIEARQMKSIAGCKAEWIIRWSASREAFSGSPGPLHTKSKRFSSLKNSPEKIAAMLCEIGDYEELSANLDSGDDWQSDAGEAALWLEDYWRVIEESEAQQAAAEEEEPLADVVDQILRAPPSDEDDEEFEPAADTPAPEAEEDEPPLSFADHVIAEAPATAAQLDAEQAIAAALSLPLRYLELARSAQDNASWALHVLKDDTLAIRLAVYHKLLGASDDSYPDAWLDPATGELPTLQQLAALDRISMPTLRKRRNAAIDKLHAAPARGSVKKEFA